MKKKKKREEKSSRQTFNSLLRDFPTSVRVWHSLYSLRAGEAEGVRLIARKAKLEQLNAWFLS